MLLVHLNNYSLFFVQFLAKEDADQFVPCLEKIEDILLVCEELMKIKDADFQRVNVDPEKRCIEFKIQYYARTVSTHTSEQSVFGEECPLFIGNKIKYFLVKSTEKNKILLAQNFDDGPVYYMGVVTIRKKRENEEKDNNGQIRDLVADGDRRAESSKRKSTDEHDKQKRKKN